MGGRGPKVVPASLKALSVEMQGRTWRPVTTVVAPGDGLQIARDWSANLNENAQALAGYNMLAEAQNARLAETLRNVANAYEEVDKTYGDKMSEDPGRAAAVDAITIAAPSTQLPPIPDGPGAMPAPSEGGYADVKAVQTALAEGGDHCASLQEAIAEWRLQAAVAAANAEAPFPTDWEGDAADAALKSINSYSEWSRDLSAAWTRLAIAGTKVQGSHVDAVSSHTSVYAWYVALETQMQELLAQGVAFSDPAIVERQHGMQALQKQSESIREDYANQAAFDAAKPSEPPFGDHAGGATANVPGGGAGGNGTGGGGGGLGGGTPPTSQTPQTPSANVSTSPAAAQETPSGGEPSSGGSPSGGESSGSGASPGGGMPSTPDLGEPSTDIPNLDDPSVNPAAASAGGGGGSGAGGGGGVSSMPLQPNVGGVAVGPSPGGAAGSGGGPAAGAGPGGRGGGGGMGGGMPMRGAGQGEGGKEKRRTPGLSPDEDLYTEERPWTEAVIGNRRRRDVADGRDVSDNKDVSDDRDDKDSN